MLRISGGVWRGRVIESAPGSRPTQEKLRQALFDRWGPRVDGARFLDLFCGGGAVGLEALSRGAELTVFVDAERGALATSKANLSKLDAVERAKTLRSVLGPRGFEPALAALGSFDLVFADPPYDFAHWESLLKSAAQRLQRNGELTVEHSARVELPTVEQWTDAPVYQVDTRRYGESAVTWYRRSQEGPSSAVAESRSEQSF